MFAVFTCRRSRLGGRGDGGGQRGEGVVGEAAGSCALSRGEYLDGLAAAGFVDAEVQYTSEAAPGMHTAIGRAVKRAG
jgi:hypothetical protein